MSILADRIEQFILSKLLEEQKSMEEGIVLRRNELADELNCAPSQISYVLSTRFSNDRGFIVESRRGLGGFISITRIPMKSVSIQSIKPMTVPAIGQLTSSQVGEGRAGSVYGATHTTNSASASAASESAPSTAKAGRKAQRSQGSADRTSSKQTGEPITIGAIDHFLFEMIQSKWLSRREAALLHEAFRVLMNETEQQRREANIKQLCQKILSMVKEG